MAADEEQVTRHDTPFGDLDDFLRLPRVGGLAVSPDGTRVVVAISELNDKGTEFVGALWELDPDGVGPARRLTRGWRGESSPEFTSGGDLLFLAERPTADDDTAPKSLWCLPVTGGEAYQVATLPGGIDSVRAAGGSTVVGTSLLPSAVDVDDDDARRRARKDLKVSAVLHTGYPVRFWDHDLGPAQTHLFAVGDSGVPLRRDLTPAPQEALRDNQFDVSPDGSFVVTTWRLPAPGAAVRTTLVRIEVADGRRATVVDDPAADVGSPSISPDGASVAYLRETISTPTRAPRVTLCVADFHGRSRELTLGWDRWPTSVTWTADGAALIVTADENGRGPVFSVDPDTGSVLALVSDDHTYSNVRTAPDGVVFALRSSYLAPAHPVRIEATVGAGTGSAAIVTTLDCVPLPRLPGRLTEIETAVDGGHTVRAWLVLPQAEEPAPLLLWIHGGPLASWNAWHWRWNPWVMAARGYAVLLPDPALSTGYGQDFIQRGWGAWGFAPFTDLMAVTDAACAHPAVDRTRTAAMGGSFGGYMANWIAGHTDRFAAIVTHASLWALDQFGSTTDGGYWWAREMTPEMTSANSPHLFVSRIGTPMLVIHGDKDYRVPIGEALRLWYELLSRSALPAADDGSTEHRFLYFPSENHWVLQPQHAKLWYEIVLGFLAHHVLGQAEIRPELLG